jgi:hypothetical protein
MCNSTIHMMPIQHLYTHTVNSFVWQIKLSLLQISLFKVIKRKYFSQGKCESMKSLVLCLDQIKSLTL